MRYDLVIGSHQCPFSQLFLSRSSMFLFVRRKRFSSSLHTLPTTVYSTEKRL